MNFMLRALLIAGLACLGLDRLAPCRAADRPNVLFIAVDDLNDWVSPLGGYEGIQTPNFDRLAKRSVTFTRAYCAAPACNPSRAALMTGRRPSTSGVYSNGQPWRPPQPDTITMGQHFRAHGYEVLGGGKIFHSGSLRSLYNDPPSWDEYFDRPGDPKPAHTPLNGIPNTSHFDWGPVEADDAEMADTQVVDWAAKQLANKHDRPLFLAVGLYRPHLPWYVPAKYFDQYPLDQVRRPKVLENDLDDVPPAGVRMAKPEGDHRRVLETDNWERAVQGYLACIAYTDGQVGRLLDALETGPLADNTIVVLWGDHGWHLGEKQHWRKFALWEEATRVPFFMSVPGLSPAGAHCQRTVSLLDIYPTLTDLCGLPAVAACEGDSLRPLLANPAAEWNRPVLCTHGKDNHSVRSERYRYIRYANGDEELYDHDNDPLEWTNLADRSDLESVKRELVSHLPQVNVPAVPNEASYREAAQPNRRARRQSQN